MQRAFVFVLTLSVAVVVACSSGSNPPPVDSAGSGSGSGSGVLGFGSACTIVSDTNTTECISHVCTNSFNMFPTPVCSQKCTVLGGSDTTCPTGSMGQKCNQQGYCRP